VPTLIPAGRPVSQPSARRGIPWSRAAPLNATPAAVLPIAQDGANSNARIRAQPGDEVQIYLVHDPPTLIRSQRLLECYKLVGGPPRPRALSDVTGLEKILACPACGGILAISPATFECTRCKQQYPVRSGQIVDFHVPRDSTESAHFWDKAADTDEVKAAIALPKLEAGGIFAKFPRWLKAHAKELRSDVHVDLGCGYGRTLIYSMLSGSPSVAIGVDISAAMLQKARKQSEAHGVNPTLLRADIAQLPLASNCTDFVYSSAVLLHLPKRTVQSVIREVKRILRPSGVAVFESSFPGSMNLEGLQTLVITRLLSKWLSPAWVRTYRFVELQRLFAHEFSRSYHYPEGYILLPRSILQIPLPSFLQSWARGMNRAVSKRLRFREVLVAGWAIRAQK
jgi:arsenite methyltransferase